MSAASDASVVITGAGLVAALGLDRRSVWRAVCEGACGIGPHTALEQTPVPDRGGGEAPPLPESESPDLPREARYLRRAVQEAVGEAGLAGGLPHPPHRCGLVLGTTLHGMRAAGRFFRSDDPGELKTFLAPTTADLAAGDLGLEGLAVTTCSACSSGLGSVGLALTMLRSGALDLVIAGGYDPISEYAYAGFNSLRLVAEGPARPFCAGREGLKLGEGYGVVVLERAADAAARGASVLASVRGLGETVDAHHLTQPHPEGDGAARAVQRAIEDAGVSADELDLIVAHATSTPDNDVGEARALRRVFGDRLGEIPLVSFKSHLGHTLGGAGTVELILGMMALADGVVPPTVNVRADAIEYEGIRLNDTGRVQHAALRRSLHLSLGFGGANTCVVLEPAPGSAPPAAPAVQASKSDPQPVWITGVGVVLPGAIGNEAFASLLGAGGDQPIRLDTGDIDESELAGLLNARRIRRMSQYVKLSLAATTLAVADANLDADAAFDDRTDAILGSDHGSAIYSGEYYAQVVAEGIDAANPMLFAEGVPNAAAAHLSLMLGLKGSCQSLIGSRTTGLEAVRLAADRIATGRWRRALISTGEEYAPLVRRAYEHCGLYTGGRDGGTPFADTRGFVCGAGAVTVVLESAAEAEKRGARARGVLDGAAGGACRPDDLRRQVQTARRVMDELGHPETLFTSANATWLDRVEGAALAGSRHVTALYGHIAETYSVMPLASLAAGLLRPHVPRLRGRLPATENGPRGAEGTEPIGTFGVLCSDYAGLIAGIRVSRKNGS